MATTQGQAESIATVLLLITSSLAVAVRLFVKWSSSGKFHLDDALAVLALLCSIGSGATVVVMGEKVLGYPTQHVDLRHRDIFAKSLYAANLLYIVTLGFAKLSIVALFNLVTAKELHIWLGRGLGAFIALWTFTAFIAAALTCKTPQVWNIWGQCFNKATYWYTFGAINIVTDVALIAFPLYVMMPLQMSWTRKAMVLGCFGARIFDVAASIVQLQFTSDYNSRNITEDLFPWILMAQITQCITIITSCVPYLRPLLESLPTGMFMSDEIRRRGAAYAGAQHYVKTPDFGYVLQDVSRDGSGTKTTKSVDPPGGAQ